MLLHAVSRGLAGLLLLGAGRAAAPQAGRDLSYNASGAAPRSPEVQRASFRVPAGFEVELVAAESPGLGKFIGLVWDARMRLWSMTALEYPVDANENRAESEARFARGGRDRVVVFDEPHAPRPGPPRVFADGLVMPLGVQPWGDGALVQYGPDIRWYRDADGDGRADRHEVVLTGFGTQDSHLFPHQFLRQPGGWIFVAQGLFNTSQVRRPGGRPFADGTTVVPFLQCKLARFQPDGSAFETLTAGPNNIWGLVTSREGETFLQEANDQGYPVIPYAPGIWVRTGSKDLLRPYQPLLPPPLAPARMGGTGLSGLALAEDHATPFRTPAGATAPGTKVFFLANPITGAIQVVTATPDGPRHRYAKGPDFLTTDDRWFRPIALAFGPDGALYVVDWYNRIISHNEVPRTHPDRDKARGRIWRIRYRDQPRTAPPDLTRLGGPELLAQLGHPRALVSRLAWLEITDRRATALAPDLARLAADRAAPLDRRLAALWALEGLRAPAPDLLAGLAADPDPAPRREAARLAAGAGEEVFLRVAGPLVADPHPAVRAAVGDALRRVPGAGPRVMGLAACLGRAPLGPEAREDERYEREFERYLARWALERHPDATRALLASPAGRALPAENRALATLALGGQEAAAGLAGLAGELRRPLQREEIRTLAAHFGEPAVRSVLVAALAGEGTRRPALRALLAVRTGLDLEPLSTDLAAAAGPLLSSAAPGDALLGAEVAGAFRLRTLAEALQRLVERDSARTPVALAALRALRENGEGRPGPLAGLLEQTAPGPAADELIATLAGTRDPAGPATLARLLPGLGDAARGRALDHLSRTPAGAAALAAELATGRLSPAAVGPAALERLRLQQPGDAALSALAAQAGPAEAAGQEETFRRYRALADGRGDPGRGRELFTALCLPCHQQAGKGGQLGPALDGVGLTGVEALLRNLLTPSAAMESAYRTYRVVTRDGTVHEGFLAADTPEALVLRLPGAPDRRLARGEVRSSGYLARSLMPEGLLEGLTEPQAADLLAYLLALR